MNERTMPGSGLIVCPAMGVVPGGSLVHSEHVMQIFLKSLPGVPRKTGSNILHEESLYKA